MKEFSLKNQLNQSIYLTLFEPIISNNKFILINSATGVKQQIYFGISKYLAENGFTVITYDYSGIGLSKPKNLKSSSSSMRSWGGEDYKSVTQFIKANYFHYTKYLIGHSVGALILGMNEDSKLFSKFIFYGTQKAYTKHLKWKTKLLAFGGFGIVQPFTTKMLGYFPAHRFNLGESLPPSVAYDWRTLILNKKSTNALLHKSEIDISKELFQKVLVLRAEDDHWLTEIGVENLLKETYPNLEPTYKLINLSDSPKKEIGHINFFRSYNKILWKIIVEEFQK